MKSTAHIKTHISVCDDAPAFTVGGRTYEPGSRAPLAEVKLEILEGDVLSITLPGHEAKPKVGGASKIDGISIRSCGDKTSIIAHYTDSQMNLEGCCVCCDNGHGTWCAYGSSGCVCC